MKPLRDAIRREAGRVWRDKARARVLGLFLNEETITESTLLNLATGFQGNGLFVQLFTKAQERRNGADWEFWFVQGTKAAGLRVQAKRLFPSGAYDSLDPSGPQTKNLITNARNCYPLYVFYNDSDAYRSSLPKCTCGEYNAQSYLGCTLAPATAVARAGSKSASSIQGIAIPWHCLLCESAAKETSMPDVIAGKLNSCLANTDDHRCEVVETPRCFWPDAGVDVLASPKLPKAEDHDEPRWLTEYLAERLLAGVAVFCAAEGPE